MMGSLADPSNLTPASFGDAQFPLAAPQMGQIVPPAAPSLKGGGFFGEGGAGRPIAGYIGDALLQMSGMKPIYQPLAQENYQRSLMAKQAAVNNSAEWQKWLMQQMYKDAHPEQTADEKMLVASGLKPGTPEYQAAARDLVNRRSDPFITTSLPGGGFYGGPQSQLIPILQGGSSPAISAPVGKLTPIPGGAAPQAPAPSPGGYAPPTRINRAQAAQIRASLGPNGNAAFNQWLTAHNVQVTD